MKITLAVKKGGGFALDIDSDAEVAMRHGSDGHHLVVDGLLNLTLHPGASASVTMDLNAASQQAATGAAPRSPALDFPSPRAGLGLPDSGSPGSGSDARFPGQGGSPL